MDQTRFVYQKSEKYPDQVAVMASFVPTFTQSAHNDSIAITEGTTLEELDVQKELESKYQYIFLIDRSGSMGM